MPHGLLLRGLGPGCAWGSRDGHRRDAWPDGMIIIGPVLGDCPVAATAARGAYASVHRCLARLRGQARANAGVYEGPKPYCRPALITDNRAIPGLRKNNHILE